MHVINQWTLKIELRLGNPTSASPTFNRTEQIPEKVMMQREAQPSDHFKVANTNLGDVDGVCSIWNFLYSFANYPRSKDWQHVNCLLLQDLNSSLWNPWFAPSLTLEFHGCSSRCQTIKWLIKMLMILWPIKDNFSDWFQDNLIRQEWSYRTGTSKRTWRSAAKLAEPSGGCHYKEWLFSPVGICVLGTGSWQMSIQLPELIAKPFEK